MGARLGTLFLLLGVVMLLISGCSLGEKRESLDDTTATATTTVKMARSYRFSPEVIKVKVGDTVTWKNEDEFTHDVHVFKGSDTDRHQVKPGESTTVTFDKAGSFDYECTLHPRDMRGRVVVSA